jgi:integrase
MIDYLRKHLEEQDSTKKIKTEEWKENDLIFPTKLGTPMHPTSMYKEYKALLRKTDLPDIRFHDLRHYGKLNVMGSVCDLTGKFAEISWKRFP